MNAEVIGKQIGEGKPKLANGTLVVNRDVCYFDALQSFVVASTATATKASNGPFHGEFDRLILRLRARLADPRLRFLFYPVKADGTSLVTSDFADVVRQFIGYLTQSNVSIVDLSGIPFEVLSIVVSLISRMIFDFGFHYSKSRHVGGNVSDVPIMVVCEEAHNYVPRSGGAQYDSSRKSIERIAKEGRKYGVTLMVVSQRPSEVSETIFSQCSNFISLRLTNAVDQSYIKSLLPDLSAGVGDLLPNLGQGEFLIVGDAPLMPTVGRFALPVPEPHSRSVNYLQEWNADWREVDFDDVIDRWRGKVFAANV
ncbi:ATP-binding protein [Komagataeibacter oboediens]|uniref:ATP-binding protein n=1 Tax=Komagataeibacter oboediens TaxID=65958 RepID=UPI001C2BCB9C|nr:ATP-binding protein [Komagataeibacter oboediens]MBV0890092.1 ATP-binding protein [Komagataeibacter oboediens]MCK9820268.1 ATP-binding protein [Komagataeibacter oboediens]